ncbi:MAG TPA: hypothetical protein VMD59_11930, partial [Acidimicrobiales bacterium]|nr:hypothetical protein [Acidimicrobiales bacterium]
MPPTSAPLAGPGAGARPGLAAFPAPAATTDHGATSPLGARQPAEAVRIGALGRPRLLAAALAPADPGLEAHLCLHGPLPWPAPRLGRGGTPPLAVWSETLLAEIAAAGLAGRGGAWFPSDRKLAAGRAAGAALLLVNAMEGEPASRKDAVLLASAPHLVLDGAELAALAVGAAEIRVCLDASRTEAVAILERAIAERRRRSAARWDGARHDGARHGGAHHGGAHHGGARHGGARGDGAS